MGLAGCAIDNDIPYPIIEGNILSFEVEGQRASASGGAAAATIDKTNRKVTLYVDDTVDLTSVRITKFTVTDGASIVVNNPDVLADASNFPTAGFESLDVIPYSKNTQVDFSSPVQFTIKTYQEYVWTVVVEQIIDRDIVLDNQIGNAVIDDVHKTVVIYVSQDQPLNQIRVSKFDLGGEHGTVVPDPTVVEYYDFSGECKFHVSRAWEEASSEWRVFVYQKEGSASAESSIFPMAVSASISGTVQSGKSVAVEYRKKGESSWNSLASSAIRVSGVAFTASLSGLTPGTNYEYRVSMGGTAGEANSFTTAPATSLPDGSFDNWHQDDKLWNPWAQGGTSYWDTGNRGATTVGNSNSVPSDDTCNGSGTAALLESKYIVVKFAAGNIFTGSYLRTTGTNGVLGFGREFTSFPTKLRVNYKCEVTNINRIGDDAFEYLKGRPDTCHIYIALTDWDEPYEIRTRPSERQLFDKNSSNVIAYGELLQGETVSSWQQVDIPLTYRYTNRTPKYILVVASASKFGDYFVGGEGTKLWVDNFELLYE